MSTARSSESVFGSIEPKNTKYVYTRVQTYVLDQLTARLGNVIFAQVGANDGLRADPINPYIMKGHWRGLLIEPLPACFATLQQTYAGIAGLTFANLAIADTNGTATFYAVDGATDVLSSFSRSAIMKHAETRPGLESLIKEITVPTMRLDDLLAEHGYDALDILVVDTEGCDDMVLSTFDLARFKPAIVLFEHVLLSHGGSEKVRAQFTSEGYTLIWDRHDVLAIREGFFDAELTRFLHEVVEVAKQK